MMPQPFLSFSSQYVMPISPYFTVAIARCSWAGSGFPVRHPAWPSLRAVSSPIRAVGRRSVDRRALLRTVAGGLLGTPLATEAQPVAQSYRIGIRVDDCKRALDSSAPGIALALIAQLA